MTTVSFKRFVGRLSEPPLDPHEVEHEAWMVDSASVEYVEPEGRWCLGCGLLDSDPIHDPRYRRLAA